MTNSTTSQPSQTDDRVISADQQTSGAQAPDVLVHKGEVKSHYKAPKTCKIIVDSCADFARDLIDQLDVECVCFTYIIDGKEYVDDIWQSQTAHEFYEQMRQGKQATTTAITPGRYFEVFEECVKEGIPTLYLGFTGGLSSSIHSAETARDMIKERYPDFELYVVDNLCPSASAQLLALEVVRQAENGMSAEELYQWVLDARYFVHGFFTLDNFDALAKGGRIPPTAAQMGSKLDIKPELTYDLNGALSLRKMCRGRKKALKAILDEWRAARSDDMTLPLAIVTSDAEKDGDWLENAVRKEKGFEDAVIIRSSVSPVIGSHTGPGMVALCFWGVDRRDNVSLADKIAKKIKKQDA